MSREEVVRISRMVNDGSIDTNTICSLIAEYCIAKGKSEEDTNTFINYISGIVGLLPSYITTALSYFEREFLVYKLYSKPDTEGKRTLLQIF